MAAPPFPTGLCRPDRWTLKCLAGKAALSAAGRLHARVNLLGGVGLPHRLLQIQQLHSRHYLHRRTPRPLYFPRLLHLYKVLTASLPESLLGIVYFRAGSVVVLRG